MVTSRMTPMASHSPRVMGGSGVSPGSCGTETLVRRGGAQSHEGERQGDQRRQPDVGRERVSEILAQEEEEPGG